MSAMLDFTQSRLPSAQKRCKRRAGTAKKAARIMYVVLVGLIGATLISEPALVGATRGGLATMHASLQGTLRPIPDTPGIFDLPVAVATMPIGGLEGDVVAQNDVDILGEFGEPATR